jgi:hypothetical protein
MLTESQVERFIAEGFVRIDDAFSRTDAALARAILWKDLAGCDRNDPRTWTRPVVRLGLYTQPPFQAAASGPRLRAAFDSLLGAGRWQPCTHVGTFPIRFPSTADGGDTGWHIDPGFDFHLPDFMDWRANLYSRGRALLLLMLFSDVGEEDAPTRIRLGSHADIARSLAGAGERGKSLRELAQEGFATAQSRAETLAVGPAGTVYCCHPFLVHAAQSHRGSSPRFMAQPPLLLRPGHEFRLSGADLCPVEQAIASAMVTPSG